MNTITLTDHSLTVDIYIMYLSVKISRAKRNHVMERKWFQNIPSVPTA